MINAGQVIQAFNNPQVTQVASQILSNPNGINFQTMLNNALSTEADFGAARVAAAAPDLIKKQQGASHVTQTKDTYIAQLIDPSQLDSAADLQGLPSPDALSAISEEAQNPLTSSNVNDVALQSSRLSITPFQFFIDKGIDFFRRVSGMEWHADILMEKFARGEASIEEMTIEKAKVGVALSFATTLVSQVTQAFNELKNMQV